MFTRIAVVRAGVAAIALGIAAVLFAPQSAAAAGELQLSDDGVTYGSSLPAPLFDGLSALRPMGSQSEAFYVRNAGAQAAYLRITLDNPTSSSAAFAAALTVSVSVPGHPGTPVILSSASDCSILLAGSRIEPGATVVVTTTISLGNLSGTSGQNATASMDFGLTLTQAVGAPGTGCGTPTVIVPGGTPPPATDPVVDEEEEVTPPTPPVEEPEEPGGQLETLPFFNTVTSGAAFLLYIAIAIPLGAAAYFFLPALARRRHHETYEGDLP